MKTNLYMLFGRNVADEICNKTMWKNVRFIR